MENFVLIDGNSIMNRAFYGIMGSKMLTTKDGKYTNAVYGFLAILFKLIEDTNPKYMAVAFDLKAPTARHKLYEGYKANRKGMPDELAEQMPLIKEILKAMNIDIVEKEGYEADDPADDRDPDVVVEDVRGEECHGYDGDPHDHRDDIEQPDVPHAPSSVVSMNMSLLSPRYARTV